MNVVAQYWFVVISCVWRIST